MSRRARGLFAVAVSVGLAWLPHNAWATSESLFGFGPRSAALAQADIADVNPTAAAYGNPAFAAQESTRIAIGYSRGWPFLNLDGERVPMRDISGLDLGLQAGWRIGEEVTVGGAVGIHLPDRSLARVAFQPGTEPLFVRFEPAVQRTTAELAAALRVGVLSLGVGASVLVDAQGEIDLLLGQDGNGAYADGRADITLPYHIAPTAGAALHLGPAALGARYRGAHSIDIDLDTRTDVDVTGNPLNGSTTVRAAGMSGYIPSTFDLGARYDLTSRLRLLTSLQLARWSQAPSPAADLSVDVQLGLTPGLLESRFVRPAFRDTLSPRIAAELHPLQDPELLSLRIGYAYSPSPIPKQTGFASHADAPFHTVAFGGGVDLGRLWGVHLRSDLGLQLLWLEERRFDKPSEVLPFAHYTVDGRVLFGSIGLEGAWR